MNININIFKIIIKTSKKFWLTAYKSFYFADEVTNVTKNMECVSLFFLFACLLGYIFVEIYMEIYRPKSLIIQFNPSPCQPALQHAIQMHL